MHPVQTKEAVPSYSVQPIIWTFHVYRSATPRQFIDFTKKNERHSRDARVNGFLTIR
jgi:hypothetical protein